jgi:hypothetical protein
LGERASLSSQQLVQSDRDDDHGTVDEEAPLGVDAEEQDPAGDDLDDQGPDDGAQTATGVQDVKPVNR